MRPTPNVLPLLLHWGANLNDEQKRIIANLAECGLAEFVAAQPAGHRIGTARKVLELIDSLDEPETDEPVIT